MQKRIIDKDITLLPYYPNAEVSLAWYQDPDVCKQVDNIDHVYDLELLNRMYDFLSTHGDCYYIEYQGKLVGDIDFMENGMTELITNLERQSEAKTLRDKQREGRPIR